MRAPADVKCACAASQQQHLAAAISNREELRWREATNLISSDSMHESTHTTATRHAPRIAPMVALARGLGAACRISVARLRPAESDVRGRSSTWSRTFGAVRQVRGGAEAGFWVVCWVARGSARQLAAAGSGSGAAERGRGALCRVSPWAGGVQRLFWPAHSPGAATDRPHGGACLGAQVGRLGSSFGPTMRSWRVSRTRAQWRLSPPP